MSGKKVVGPTHPLRHFIGSHMSSAGGVDKAAERAGEIGCRALQLFVKNNNRWDGPPISDETAKHFRAKLATAGIRPEHTFAHTSYLINLGSQKEDVVQRSIGALEDELRRCEQIGLMGLVMHPGSPADCDPVESLERVSKLSREILVRAGGKVRLLFETTAGTGRTFGASFEQLAQILDETNLPDRVGVCLDTCHIFAAGYEIRNPKGYAETFARFDATVGFKRLFAVHLNDSKMPFASRKDRHEHIGKGEIGEEAFRLLLADPRFEPIPMALETEKDDENANDLMNFVTLARLEELPTKRSPKK